MNPEARRLIESIGMISHPEGGFYRETFRSAASVTTHDGKTRRAATSIYFLLTDESFSAFHRIASDETWHFYRGDPLTIEIVMPDGTSDSRVLGIDDAFQTTVPSRAFFASHVVREGGYALVGCDVAPGFEFEDFELGVRSDLIAKYPARATLFERFTRT